MKRFLIIFFIFCLVNIAQADELSIPFSCWPNELQREFNEVGIKLDLSGNERTNDSWGYILNKGNNFSIFTYGSINPDELDIVSYIVNKIEREKKDK